MKTSLGDTKSIVGLAFKIVFAVFVAWVAFDPRESVGNRVVAAAFLVMIWMSVIDSEANSRHRELMAKLERIRLGDKDL